MLSELKEEAFSCGFQKSALKAEGKEPKISFSGKLDLSNPAQCPDGECWDESDEAITLHGVWV